MASLPVGLLSVSSETLGAKEIRDLAYFTVRQQIATIPGISFGPPLGGKVRQITVFLDQQRMVAREVSPSDVVKALNSQSAIIPAGNMKIGDLNYYVYSNSLIDVIEKINDIPIKIVNGTPIFVRDIGTASDSAAVQTSIVRVNGREATYIPITRQEGANSLEVTNRIRAKLPKLTESPADARSNSSMINRSISGRPLPICRGRAAGGCVAGLMIFLFISSIKAALVVGLAIPLSLTSALVALYLTGKNVNIMTLGGFALVIGTLSTTSSSCRNTCIAIWRWAKTAARRRKSARRADATDSRRYDLHPDRVPPHHVLRRDHQICFVPSPWPRLCNAR